ncbi:MAG: ATP-dependent DNA helicase [Gammaproteobacteria bacterium]|nr:ATP-dependent DNA helicase [Gammaproteobacteria bacterium]
MTHPLQDALSADGSLATSLPGFAPRLQQQQMAEAIESALQDKAWLVAEAGTGTGKTFAYLVPSLLSTKKVLISTGTKNLQDQLFHKDIPLVQKALGVPVQVALLKGRANYLCPQRLELAFQDNRSLTHQGLNKLRHIGEWAGHTQLGDRAEVDEIAEDDVIWARVTSTAENCLGQDCPKINDCYLVKARRAAQAADIVVINHHLLFADMSIKEQGFGELLPMADAVVIDEAHQLAEAASAFFGIGMSGNQLRELARDSEAAFYKEINEGNAVPKACDALDKAVLDMRLDFGQAQRRGSWNDIRHNKQLQKSIVTLTNCLVKLHNQLEPLAERSKDLESCYRRCRELSEQFSMLTGEPTEGYIHWFETHKRTFSLHLTPLDISDNFRGHLESMPGAWIFTSATLSVNGGFNHFISQLGLNEAITRSWDSPFDFARQALLYMPTGLPEPNQASYTEAVVESARPVLAASGGRAFMLFTSHRALREAAEILGNDCDYPILVQGSAPRDRLLEDFRKAGNAVLLGTSSFWEGVDVRGEALSCVIIDKLPFASPGDPVLQARLEAMRREGNNPFMEFQLPQAVIMLKQGAGRLIRDVQDSGVLMICDPRLKSKPYGRIFLASLPKMPQTRELKVVESFYSRKQQPVASGRLSETACH